MADALAASLAAWLGLLGMIPDWIWIGVAGAAVYYVLLLPLGHAWDRYLNTAIDRRLREHGIRLKRDDD